MSIFINEVEALRWHRPASTDISEKILMKIADMIGIAFIYLTNALGLYKLMVVLTINFGIKGQFDWVHHIVIKHSEINTRTIPLHRVLNMAKK